MHGVDLIGTLAGGLASALLFGYITQRLGLSPIVGYLVGGLLIGPYTPGFVADPRLAEQLAEIGIILLMFGVGLQFHVEELLAVRRVAVPGAIAQSVVATLLGAAAASMFGWSWAAGLVFGIALSVASTVVLIRILADNNDLHTPAGHIAVGWLVVEDLFTVVVLVVLPVLFGGSSSGSGLALALTITAFKVTALVVFTLVVGNRVLPWLLDRVAATRSRELFTLTVLVLALGIAVGSAAVFGVSMALGAFLAGLVVGRSDYSSRAAADALPMRDAFAVLFFVSVGMLLNPRFLIDSPGLIGATLAVVLVGKPLTAAVVVRLLKYPIGVALAVAVALAQIGEFSFILAALAKQLGILGDDAVNAIVAVSIFSIVANPPLYRALKPVERWASRRPRLWRLLNGRPDAAMGAGSGDRRPHARGTTAHRAIVVGYGPTGRTLTRLLRENGIDATVIELNMDTARRLREDGIAAVYGDASHRDTLEAAGIDTAGSLILTADLANTEEAIRQARTMNPDIQVLARTAHLRDLKPLRHAGAQRAFSGEGEVALALSQAILERLGATPEQFDRERDRVHAELFD